MPTKKKAAKKGGNGARLDIGSDPPILIGGGGSSLIWVDFSQGQTQIPPNSANPGAPTPTNPAKYSLSKIMNQPAKLFFNNGTTPGKAGETALVIPAANQNTWYIRFAKPGEGASGKKAKKK
ncbi:MAG TPA: hypothetical protein VN696_03360 [Pyrinomonadaceae bacterium]|nr:hypothetical protein [Pyrinomonadaceae bacterium]